LEFDDPDVVKGRAGLPCCKRIIIINPDLAVNPEKSFARI
jgi:hypothetical protein